ncbi:PRC-barrel domain-containing protein [Belnapia sp. T6]|uniref:PRC-barrel domain-containing protein n=1 Tax=Belnapia mucosa TaxID=2804532 RepID=A0ABS1V3D6_9PROT|nr:PRC-barrel domain-containing protein [Belnapia mucosa]MBL6456087.1 PRC-barrel domain-containing protein [Belnapia mucosa]
MASSPVAPGVAIEETAQLIAAAKVGGTPVYNRHAERLGTVEDVMLDKQSGRVAYAVMSFGGFLGIGERYHPLPWSKLRYDVDLGGYVVDLDRDQLQGAPSYASSEEIDWTDRQWGQRVSDYYGVSPHWAQVP